MAASVDERRKHRRLPVNTRVACRRLGRGGFDESVETVDLSAGGTLLLADRRLSVGDVLVIELSAGGFTTGIRGLVVASRAVPGAEEQRYVHVAFTGLSPERLDALYRLLDALDDEAEDAEAAEV